MICGWLVPGRYLHNLGKISSKFIDKEVKKANNGYLYQHILQLISQFKNDNISFWTKFDQVPTSNILDPQTVDCLTNNQINLGPPYNDRTYTPGDLIEYLGQGEPWYKSKMMENMA